MNNLSLPMSILDTDLYKITMQQAALQHFPNVLAAYKFTNRNGSMKWTKAAVDTARKVLAEFKSISLSSAERRFLEGACPYLTESYLDYLQAYKFKPDEVELSFIPDDPESAGEGSGNLEISIEGPWHSTILWEVPLMATLSEVYFRSIDTDWSVEGQEAQAYEKGRALLRAGCIFSDFGTRRRRSFATQDLVVANLVRAHNDLSGTPNVGALLGTSNVLLAMKYKIKPMGTIAHEWFMGVGAMKGYKEANKLALNLWEEVYPDPGVLRTALTDTFTSEVFFKDMVVNPELVLRFPALRQDSGDPFAFAPRAREMYETLKMDYKDKIIVYSDSLTVDKALELQNHTKEVGMKASFGVGTFLTNDFKRLSDPTKKSTALNIVIKLAKVDGIGCVKISDDLGKNTGLPEDVERVKGLFNLPRN